MSDMNGQKPAAGAITPNPTKQQEALAIMESLYLKLRDVHSVMACLQCVDDHCDPLTVQELPFAIGMMKKAIEAIMDDFGDLSRECRGSESGCFDKNGD